MRVLFYDSAPEWSGSTRAFAAAARGLAARGHQVTVVCAPDTPVEQRLDFGSYEVVPMRSDGPWWLVARRLRQVLALRFIEVIFVHREREQRIAGAAARMAGRAAVIRRVAAGTPISLGRAGRAALRGTATGFVFASDAEREAAPEMPRARLAPLTVPLGVAAAEYDAVRAAPRPPFDVGGISRVVLCAYDAANRMRAALALRTVAMLAPLHPELGLCVAGAGSDGEDLRMHAAALGLTKRVAFLGERDDELTLMRGADLGWVAASGDAAIWATLDLLALRVPVLVERDSVAAPYVANNITGLLLAPGDAPAAAAAIARILAHEDDREAMGDAAYARVAREFSDAEMVDAFERAAQAAADRSLWVA